VPAGTRAGASEKNGGWNPARACPLPQLEPAAGSLRSGRLVVHARTSSVTDAVAGSEREGGDGGLGVMESIGMGNGSSFFFLCENAMRGEMPPADAREAHKQPHRARQMPSPERVVTVYSAERSGFQEMFSLLSSDRLSRY
jgi:hypothetical protein